MFNRQDAIKAAKQLVKHRDWIRTIQEWQSYTVRPSQIDDVLTKVKEFCPGENITFASLCDTVAFLCYDVVPTAITELAIGEMRKWVQSGAEEPTEELREVMEAYFEANWFHRWGEKREVKIMHRKVAASRLMIDSIRFLTSEEIKIAEKVADKLAEEVMEDKEDSE